MKQQKNTLPPLLLTMQETGLMENSKQILNTKIEGDPNLIHRKLQEQKEKRDYMKAKLFNGFLYIIFGVGQALATE